MIRGANIAAGSIPDVLPTTPPGHTLRQPEGRAGGDPFHRESAGSAGKLPHARQIPDQRVSGTLHVFCDLVREIRFMATAYYCSIRALFR